MDDRIVTLTANAYLTIRGYRKANGMPKAQHIDIARIHHETRHLLAAVVNQRLRVIQWRSKHEQKRL